MAWARLDDRFHEHWKVVEAGLEAVGLWALCLTWASQARRTSPTPGVVPESVIVRFAGGPAKAKRLAARLHKVGMFDDKTPAGWPIHDFHQYLPKYDQAANVERGRAGGQARAANRTAKQTASDPASGPDETGKQTSSTRASVRRNPVPVPSSSLREEREEPSPGPTFDDFYAAYPRREARRRAEQAWQAAVKRATPEAIMAGLERFQFRQERQFIPLPASWLNADRWADEQGPAMADGRSLTGDELLAILGPDRWNPPKPPPGLSPDEEWEWRRRQQVEHIEERQQQARARAGVGA